MPESSTCLGDFAVAPNTCCPSSSSTEHMARLIKIHVVAAQMKSLYGCTEPCACSAVAVDENHSKEGVI